MKKLILCSLLTLCCCLSYGQTKKYNHILITNDNGIQDIKRLEALAKTVSEVSKRVSIIVSDTDKSGTSNRFLMGKEKSVYTVTCKSFDKEHNIGIYTIPDNPADCVILGLLGFFGKDRPDFVLSGINGGPNIGPSWFGSGTIGAVRQAALVGVKAIALSGFYSNDENSYRIIPNWIKEFISSDFIDNMDKNSYLTIAFPPIPPSKVKGIKLAERLIAVDLPTAFNENYIKKIYGGIENKPGNQTLWTLDLNNPKIKKMINDSLNDSKKNTDTNYIGQGYIVITPMTVNENNYSLLKKMKKEKNLIPKFNPDIQKDNK